MSVKDFAIVCFDIVEPRVFEDYPDMKNLYKKCVNLQTELINQLDNIQQEETLNKIVDCIYAAYDMDVRYAVIQGIKFYFYNSREYIPEDGEIGEIIGIREYLTNPVRSELQKDMIKKEAIFKQVTGDIFTKKYMKLKKAYSDYYKMVLNYVFQYSGKIISESLNLCKIDNMICQERLL